MKLKAVVDILQSKLHKRGVPLKALTYGDVEDASGGAKRRRSRCSKASRSTRRRRSCASSRTAR
jgi:uncharacterized protein YajQ (UPF0234 family)